jgi:hypothetical protein
VLADWKELSRTDAMITGGRPTSIGRYVRKRLAEQHPDWSKERIEAALAGTRASMSGPVSGKTTFEAWLKKRSVEEQNKVLGVGKAKLWRSGKIGFSDLVDQRGNPLTLAQLQAA